jgi:predicted ATP-binding protein involved in virulence
MSAGQRAFIGLIADIARRACLLNVQRLGVQTLAETPGLVLIDEIDLHLHPKWQRDIVPALKRIFPKIQFFATTHSPQVIGEARPEEIVLLSKDGQQKRPSGSYGRDSNWILECVMEAEGRDPAIAARLKSLFELIEDDKFDQARSAIKALRHDIGDGPETIGAEAYLWRLEHLGEEAAE